MPDFVTSGDCITLSIHALGAHGEGIGAIQGFTVFVDGALPDEIVEVKLIQVKKNYAVGQLLQIKQKAPFRIQPPCPYFGVCGGCQLQHLAYSKQLEMKKQRVFDALQRIGNIEAPLVEDCLPSPKEFGYRNKIQLPVRSPLKLGLFMKNSHNLIEIDACLIHSELGEQIFQEVQKHLPQSQIKAYDPKTKQGELRHILIKSALKSEEVLIVLITNQKATAALQELAQRLIKIPHVKGVVHNLHQAKENVILGKDFETLQGASYIQESLCGLKFHISAASFFQVNPLQAENLYTKALELAHLKGDEHVLDAYCGVGTMSLVFARKAKRVIGIESVSQAIEDAKANAKRNAIQNVSFTCASSEDATHFMKEIDVLIINPPRKGCDPRFLEGIQKYRPSKIIYISCDPATLARDLKYLTPSHYQLEKIQPVDMFPQTAHVECIVKLQLRQKK